MSFTVDLNKLLENALRLVTDVVLNIFAMLSRYHSRGRTHDAGSVTRIAFFFFFLMHTLTYTIYITLANTKNVIQLRRKKQY